MSEWQPPLWLDRLGGVAWRFIIVVASLALIVSLLVGLGTVVLALVLGLLFASALHPVSTWLGRRRFPPAAAAGVAVLLLLILITSVGILTVKAVANEWPQISARMSSGVDKLVDDAVDNGVDQTTAETIAHDLSETITGITGVLVTGAVHILPVLGAIVAALLLSIFVAFFFLKDGSSMWAWIVIRTGNSAQLVDDIGGRVWKTLSGFILGQTAIAAIDATCIGVGAALLGVPDPLAITLITFLGAYVPFIGAFIAGLVAVLLAVSEGGVELGVWMLLIVVIVQLIEGNVLQPWIQGRAVRLHPMVVALAVTAGGAIAGFLGILLAVPVTAAGLATLSAMRQAGFLGVDQPPQDGLPTPADVSLDSAAPT